MVEARAGWHRLGVVGLGLVVVVSGCSEPDSSSGQDIRVEHTVIDSAPDRLADSGPQPGTYQQVWQATADTGNEIAGYHLVSGHLLVVTSTGFQAYDARTGKPTWHYREPGRTVRAWAETNGAILLSTHGDRFEDQHVVGLDAGTGEQLWEKEEDWSTIVNGLGPSELAPPERGDAAAGIVVVQPDSPLYRLGIDARTGKERWRVTNSDVADRCTATSADSSAGSDDLVLVELGCGQGDGVYVALDAKSGEPRWRRSSSQGPTVRAMMRDGITLWDVGSEPPVLIGPDGQDLFVGPAGTSSSCGTLCDFVVTGGRALLSYRDDERRENVRVSVDLGTGEATVVPGSPGQVFFQVAAAVAGGRVYEVAPMVDTEDPYGGSLLPAMLSVTDPTSHRVDYAALPFPTPTVAPAVSGGWFGVAGDRIFTATQPGTLIDPSGPPVLTSYAVRDTTAPTELGGVPPKSWPDPCTLLSDVPTEAEPDSGTPVTIGSVRIPATSCMIRLPDYGSSTLMLKVVWVAATEQDADDLFEDGESPIAGADEERGVGSKDSWLRVGRTVVSLSAETGGATTEIAPIVVQNLRRAG